MSVLILYKSRIWFLFFFFFFYLFIYFYFFFFFNFFFFFFFFFFHLFIFLFFFFFFFFFFFGCCCYCCFLTRRFWFWYSQFPFSGWRCPPAYLIWGIHISTYDSPELLQILMTLTTVIKLLLPNFLGRAIVILYFVRRFRNFIADTVPC